MGKVQWTGDLETGIRVIDGQHKRIFYYVNEIYGMGDSADRETLGDIIDNLVDYTLSHFAFEEALMEEAGYEYLAVHQNTHRAFRERVESLKEEFVSGSDVSHQLAQLLESWLVNHIREDDNSYAPMVKEKMPRIEDKDAGSWLRRTMERFFA